MAMAKTSQSAADIMATGCVKTAPYLPAVPPLLRAGLFSAHRDGELMVVALPTPVEVSRYVQELEVRLVGELVRLEEDFVSCRAGNSGSKRLEYRRHRRKMTQDGRTVGVTT